VYSEGARTITVPIWPDTVGMAMVVVSVDVPRYNTVIVVN
jgi:hypothetical protein